MSAGCIFKTKFIASSSKAFKKYVDYIDREEAIRGHAYNDYNAFSTYNDYMSNPEKSTGLFTLSSDSLSLDQKTELKNVFAEAQNNGGIMNQSIFSFTWEWLQEVGLADDDKNINEALMRDYVRTAVQKLQDKENMQNFNWSAAIHSNTKHIHIHIAMVDAVPSWTEGKGRCYYNKSTGQTAQRGQIKQSSIEATKAAFINSAISSADKNKQINDIIRNRIVGLKKEMNFDSSRLQNQFMEFYAKLPKNDLTKLKYNMAAMNDYREELDALSMAFVNEYCSNDYEELLKIMSELDGQYKSAYGNTKRGNNFSSSKESDLKQRLGNAILSECRKLAKLEREKNKLIYENNSIKYNMLHNKFLMRRDINKAFMYLKEATKKDLRELRNEAYYQNLQLQQQIEQEMYR